MTAPLVVDMKPCPFCGVAPVVLTKGGSWGYYPGYAGYGCMSPKCHVHPQVLVADDEYVPDVPSIRRTRDEQLELAAAQWNQRAP